MKKVIEYRDKALGVLRNKLDGFYLGGGTALSQYYFKHRESYDLDFFTKDFNENRINSLITRIGDGIKIKPKLAGIQNQEGKAKILIYHFPIDSERLLKIDFIEDNFLLLSNLINIDGIPILSKDDIYLRKIYATCGSYLQVDQAGRQAFRGGRQEAKDFFDLFYLSKTYMPLSEFVKKFNEATERESVILWYRSYDRDTIKFDLLDIITDKEIDYREMDKHFNKEIDAIVQSEIEGL